MRLACALILGFACSLALEGAEAVPEPVPAVATAPPATAVTNAPALEAIRARLSVIESAVSGLQEATARNSATSAKTGEALRAIQQDLAAVREAAGRSSATSSETGEALHAIQQDLAAVHEATKGLSRSTAAPGDPDAKRNQERILARLSALEGLLGSAGEADPTAFGYARLAMILSGLAAVLALGGIVSLVWLRPRTTGPGSAGSVERRLNEIRETLAKLPLAAGTTKAEKAVRAGTEGAATPDPAAAALRSAAESSAREAKAVAAVVDQLRAMRASLQPAVDSMTQQAQELEERRAALAEEQAKLERAKGEMAAADHAQQKAAASAQQQAAEFAEKAQAVEARLAQYEQIWPEPLRNGGPLAATKETILAGLVAGQAEAAALAGALVTWHIVRADPQRERERWIDAAVGVGRACMAFVSAHPAASDAGNLEVAQGLTRMIKTPLEEAFPGLKLNAVYPGDRFDSDRMEAVSSVSGGRQSVRQALSWLVLEKSADATQVLRRAQVITA